MQAHPILLPSDRPLNLLVVEDNPGDVMLLEEELEGADFDVRLSIAAHGEQALSILSEAAAGASERPDMVLLDIHLPGMNGHQIYDAIRSDPRLTDIRIVFLTGFTLDNAGAEIIRDPKQTILQKPVRVADMNQLVCRQGPPRGLAGADGDGMERVNIVDSRAQALEQELGEFCSLVSHDLAATMRQLGEFSRLLVRDLRPSLSAKQEAYAERIETAAAKSREMLDSIHAYSKAHRVSLRPTQCSGEGLIAAARLRAAEFIRDNEARIEYEDIGGVYGDYELLADAFAQAIANAALYRRPDAPSTIRIRRQPHPTLWRVHISDDGMGVDPIEYESVFKMFYRARAAADRPGIGAGLSIARRIVRRHGGDMRFRASALGACLEIDLPVHN